MRKFLVVMLGFAIWCAIWAAIYDQANVWLIRHAPGTSAYKLERLMAKKYGRGTEIPVLGSSRAETCYVPSILGTNVFNYGISGSCIRETLFHLRVVLEEKQEGDIIVNLDPWGFAYYGEEKTSGFAGSYVLAALRDEVRKELPAGLIRLSDWLPGVRFQGRLRANLTAWLNVRKEVTKKVDRGATLLKQSRTNDEWKVIDAKIKPETFGNPNAEARTELDLIEKLLSDRPSVRIFWVVAPASPSWNSLYTGKSDLEKFLKTLHGQNYVVNLWTDETFATDYFADPTHLNLQGAIKFSQLLKERMEKAGSFHTNVPIKTIVKDGK